MTSDPELVMQAAAMDPLSSAVCTLDEIRQFVQTLDVAPGIKAIWAQALFGQEPAAPAANPLAGAPWVAGPCANTGADTAAASSAAASPTTGQTPLRSCPGHRSSKKRISDQPRRSAMSATTLPWLMMAMRSHSCSASSR